MSPAPSSSSPPPPKREAEGDQLNHAFSSYFHSQGNHHGESHAPVPNPVTSSNATNGIANTTIFIEKPRKALTAYNIFFKDERAKMVEEQKRTGNRIGFAGMARAVSAKWKQIDPESKAHYDKLAATEKARHARETTAWKNIKKNAQQQSSTMKQRAAGAAAAIPQPTTPRIHHNHHEQEVRVSPEEAARRRLISRRVSFDQNTRGGLSPVRSAFAAVPIGGVRMPPSRPMAGPLPSHPPLWMGPPRPHQSGGDAKGSDATLPSFEDFMLQQGFPPSQAQPQQLSQRGESSSSSMEDPFKSFFEFESLEPEPIEERTERRGNGMATAKPTTHQDSNISIQSDALMDRMGSEGTNLFLSIFQV